MNLIHMPSFSDQAVLMIGVGVDIDYALSSSPATARVCAPGCCPSGPPCGRSTPPGGPWSALLLGAVALVAVALPVFSPRLGFGDAGNRPTSDTTRRAYDLLARGFGPGVNGRLLLVAETPRWS